MIHGSATVENSSVVAAPLTPPQKLCETGVPVIMELWNCGRGWTDRICHLTDEVLVLRNNFDVYELLSRN
jgi:hypothetical protein